MYHLFKDDIELWNVWGICWDRMFSDYFHFAIGKIILHDQYISPQTFI